MITKRREFGTISILPDGLIQLREDSILEEDGVELARVYRRTLLEPSTVLPTFDQRVRAVANAVWTPQVVADYAAAKAQRLAL